jgi:hypothetical protein
MILMELSHMPGAISTTDLVPKPAADTHVVGAALANQKSVLTTADAMSSYDGS